MQSLIRHDSEAGVEHPMPYNLLEVPSLLLAGVDMRGNWIAVAVLLVIGVAILRLVNRSASTSRWWLVVAAFVCGPVSTLVFFIADVVWVSPHDYIVAQDYIETLTPILIIGFIAGSLGAAAIWATEFTSCLWRRHAASDSRPAVAEQDMNRNRR